VRTLPTTTTSDTLRPETGAPQGGRACVSVCYPGRAMAAVCEICGKKPFFGKRVSHSHHRTNRRFDPNVQRVRALVNGTPKRIYACTSCLKAGRVQRAG
jgi:large subunit ribosomal protein L28